MKGNILTTELFSDILKVENLVQRHSVTYNHVLGVPCGMQRTLLEQSFLTVRQSAGVMNKFKLYKTGEVKAISILSTLFYTLK